MATLATRRIPTLLYNYIIYGVNTGFKQKELLIIHIFKFLLDITFVAVPNLEQFEDTFFSNRAEYCQLILGPLIDS